jgi:D-alanyl-D-alanine carboxypeptidase
MDTVADVVADPAVRGQLELLSAWIEAQLAYLRNPGLALGIVLDQRLIWSRGFGFANVEARTPVHGGTIFRIASITKLFTAVAVLRLRDAGKLRLDDHVSTHLPWFRLRDDAAGSPITIRHLLTHAGGLPREAAYPYWSDGVFPTIAQVRSRLVEQERALPTDSDWKYSNLGMTLAGEIVATISGEAYADHVESRILRPLGMASSSVRSIDPRHPELATPYGRLLPDLQRVPAGFSDCCGIAPAAGIASTVEDLARFAAFLLRTESDARDGVLSLATMREMQRAQRIADDWQNGWGLGFRIARQRDKVYVGHNGALRGYRSLLQACPADRIAVVALMNSDDAKPALFVDKVFQWVAPALVRAAKAPSGPIAVDPRWSGYAGRYRNPWSDLQVAVIGADLVAFDPSLADPLPGLITLRPLGPGAFRIDCADGFASKGERAAFTGPAERATGVILGQSRFEHIAHW